MRIRTQGGCTAFCSKLKMSYADVKLLKECSKEVQDRFNEQLVHTIKENGSNDIVSVCLKRESIWHDPDAKLSVIEKRGCDWFAGESKEFHPIKWIHLDGMYKEAKSRMEKIDTNDHHYLEYII